MMILGVTHYSSDYDLRLDHSVSETDDRSLGLRTHQHLANCLQVVTQFSSMVLVHNLLLRAVIACQLSFLILVSAIRHFLSLDHVCGSTLPFNLR